MTTPKVSVLMSVYNGEHFLGEAVDSILNQSFTDFEFIIMDDASTDSTAVILDSYADPRLVRLKNDTNTGLTRSLNRGLTVARGEYIARMDADDISLPERLVQQVAYLEAHPEVGVVGVQINFIDYEGRFIGPVYHPTDPLLIAWTMQLNNCLWHPAVMFRRELVQSLGNYDTEFAFAQDYDLWLRLQNVAQIRQLPDFLLKYRIHPTSITKDRFEEQERCVAAIVRRHAGLLLPHPPADELIFALRQLLGIYPPDTRPVSQEAIDTLVELQVAFSRRQNLSQYEAQRVAHYVAEALVSFTWQAEDSLKQYALSRAAQLSNQAIVSHVVNLQQSIANQATHIANLEQLVANKEAHIANLEAHVANLEAHTTNLEQLVASKETRIGDLEQRLAVIEGTKAWRLARKWYGFKHFLAGSK